MNEQKIRRLNIRELLKGEVKRFISNEIKVSPRALAHVLDENIPTINEIIYSLVKLDPEVTFDYKNMTIISEKLNFKIILKMGITEKTPPYLAEAGFDFGKSHKSDHISVQVLPSNDIGGVAVYAKEFSIENSDIEYVKTWDNKGQKGFEMPSKGIDAEVDEIIDAIKSFNDDKSIEDEDEEVDDKNGEDKDSSDEKVKEENFSDQEVEVLDLNVKDEINRFVSNKIKVSPRALAHVLDENIPTINEIIYSLVKLDPEVTFDYKNMTIISEKLNFKIILKMGITEKTPPELAEAGFDFSKSHKSDHISVQVPPSYDIGGIADYEKEFSIRNSDIEYVKTWDNKGQKGYEMPSKGRDAEIGEIIDAIKSYNDDKLIEDEAEAGNRKPVSKK